MGDKMVSIAITGNTGIGKTFNTVLWAHKQFHGSVFIVRNLEELKHYNQERCIVFDDISFDLSDPTLLIKLCDTDLHCSIRILKPDVVKIFTHNENSAFTPLLATSEQQKAINRRLTICRIEQRNEVSQALSDQYHKLITKEHSNF